MLIAGVNLKELTARFHDCLANIDVVQAEISHARRIGFTRNSLSPGQKFLIQDCINLIEGAKPELETIRDGEHNQDFRAK